MSKSLGQIIRKRLATLPPEGQKKYLAGMSLMMDKLGKHIQEMQQQEQQPPK